MLRAAVPSWRQDVEGEADLVEEVLRVHGFDRIRAVSLPRREAMPARSGERLQTVEEPYLTARARRFAKQQQRGRIRALRARHVGEQRRRHVIGDQAFLRLVSEVVSRGFDVVGVADDVQVAEVRTGPE